MASALAAVFFIIWDVWFTKEGVWWFNDYYLIGIRFLGLPVEELIFLSAFHFPAYLPTTVLINFSDSTGKKIQKEYL